MRILLVEDNDRLGELIAAGLDRAGIAVDRFGTAGEADGAFGALGYDAAVLDLGLPDGDGMDVLRRARQRGARLPILILTARDGLGDRVGGLNAGADDYLLKPFDMEELVARLYALMRRPGGALGVALDLGNLSLDTVGRELRVDGGVVQVPRRELDLLEQLMRRAGRVVSKRWLEEALYGLEDQGSMNGVEVAVHRLRRRLQACGASVTIHTLRGVGYMLQV